MLIFILKSVACLAILFVFYKLFLEKESIHIFKRFYLLGALVFSLIVPALVFTEYVEVAPPTEVSYSVTQPTQVPDEVINVPPALEADVLDVAPILWGIYFLGLLFFGLKFIRNLFQIFRRIRKNPKYKLNRFTQVLLREKITPHTFFSYIFLNKTKFESKQIPKEVLLHEETHAQQKHSWDVVFVELLQVILWVNPFIYLAKKAIKLNHEFLADQAVLQKDIDETTYKNTLLSYLSPDSEKKYQPLANAINYSSIKKRFTIMKTQTSKKAILLRSLLLLPLLAAMLYGFSERNMVTYLQNSDENMVINDVNVEILENGNLMMNGEKVLLKDIAKEAHLINPSLEPFYIRNYVTGNILYNESQVHLIEEVEAEFHRFGISNVEHISKRTADILGKKGFKKSLYSGKTKSEAIKLRRKKVLCETGCIEDDTTLYEIVWIEIKNENEIWYKDKLIIPDQLAKTITASLKKPDREKGFTVQVYSKGILHSNFVDKVTEELRKSGAKTTQIFTEEYIMQEGEYKENIPITAETVRLRANKMTFEYETKPIVININKKGQLLVQDDLVALKDLDTYLSKLVSQLSKEQKLKKLRSIIYIDVDSPEQVIDSVYRILVQYSDPSIQPIEEGFIENATPRQVAKKELEVNSNKLKKDEKLIFRYNKKGQLFFNSEIIVENDLIKKLSNSNFISIDKFTKAYVYAENASDDNINQLLQILWDAGILVENVGIVNVNNKSNQVSATKKEIAEYNTLAKKYNTMLAESKSIQIKKQDVDRLEYIYGLMSDKQKANAEPFPDFPEPPPAPKAPRVMNGEASNIPPPPSPNKYYVGKENDVVAFKGPTPKKPLKAPKTSKSIKGGASINPPGAKLSDLAYADKVIDETIANQDPYDHSNAQYTIVNGKVSKSFSSINQPKGFKAKEVKTGFLEVNGQTLYYVTKKEKTTYFNRWGQKVNRKGEIIDKEQTHAEEIIEGQVISKVYKEDKVIAQFNTENVGTSIVPPLNDITPPKPPKPPKPISPLDYVINMAKKNAQFYYEGKEISSDKAIELLKDNKELNMDSRASNSKRPVVKLSKEPITIDN
ncbi:M56 family metallopeptidase [Maribacter sp. 2308TA10-17]|uniref:M56 family metallopeptidase n=1 Tax=Maribacter sp. 2308TA10-17 TaxID=3386276 RepID=UPI0039BD75EA